MVVVAPAVNEYALFEAALLTPPMRPFITFEGLDKSGKSAQVEMAAKRIRALGHYVTEVREPGGTPYAERVRGLIMQDRSETLNPLSNAMMFAAARADVTKEIITPALDAGSVVLSDRYVHSTLAYQHYGNGLDWDTTCDLCGMSSYNETPRLTIYLDIRVEEMFERRERAKHTDIRDYESDSFYRRVRAGYVKLLGGAVPLWTEEALILDGTMPPHILSDIIMGKIIPILTYLD